MRRTHLAFLLASALSVGIPASAFAVEGDQVDGRGVDFIGGKFTFTSSATGAADRANGSFKYTVTNNDPNGRILGNVTCQRIVGNAAVLGGVITSSNVPFNSVGQPFQVFVNDEAKPGDGADDFNWFASGPVGAPPVCGVSSQFEANIQDGDIVIDPA